jgi:Membrane bound beta barrel domain (DUF5777)
MNKNSMLMFFFLTLTAFAMAQEIDLDKMLEEEQKNDLKNKVQFTVATFKTTRLIHGHSIENTAPGILDLKISHRFGQLNGGLYEFFGLDNASMRWGFDYGVTPKLTVGFGRSTYQKQYDVFVKYKILQQSTGKINMPVSLSLMSTAMIQTLKWADPNRENYFSSRLYYAYQLLAARKFSENTSLQIMPTMVHYNLVPKATDPNDILALGIGGRQKISKRVSINLEYYYQLPGYKLENTTNSLSVGFDIETGGHVFQLHFTNAPGMTERVFVSETFGRWDKGDILFGFNVSRVFSFKRGKK